MALEPAAVLPHDAGVPPPNLTARVVVEQGSIIVRERYVGAGNQIIGMSGPPRRSRNRAAGSVSRAARIVAAAREPIGRG